MTKIAFRLPNADGKVLTMNADTFEAARSPITFAKAKREGYEVRDWPTDFFGKPIPSDALAQHMPEPEAPADPAKQLRLERFAVLLNADKNSAATRDDVMALAASDIELDTAKAFIRGLPSAQTETDNEKDSDVTAYRNVPNDDRSKQRAIEIKLLGLETRASAGDPKAAETWKSIRYAKSVASATGKHLFAVMADMGIQL